MLSSFTLQWYWAQTLIQKHQNARQESWLKDTTSAGKVKFSMAINRLGDLVTLSISNRSVDWLMKISIIEISDECPLI
jgi:hypothetical protein|tara:strand:+ start:5661 stop:5894 length:234 start_codon:yes stop_codon:yes gene_type:complete